MSFITALIIVACGMQPKPECASEVIQCLKVNSKVMVFELEDTCLDPIKAKYTPISSLGK